MSKTRKNENVLKRLSELTRYFIGRARKDGILEKTLVGEVLEDGQ